MFPNLTTDEVMELAGKVGRRVAREYPGIEADDITSAALAELSGKASRLKSDDEPYIYKVLYNDAVRYAAKERYDFLVGTSTYLYQPKEVRALLAEAYFDPAMWDVPSSKDDRLSATISGKTVGVSLFDIKQSWEGLKQSYVDLLIRRFRDDEEIKDTKSVTRAIDALTRRMNSGINRSGYEHDGPGSPARVSPANNVAAQHRTNSDMGFERETFRDDAVDELQSVRMKEPSKPAGTFFDWNKGAA